MLIVKLPEKELFFDIADISQKTAFWECFFSLFYRRERRGHREIFNNSPHSIGKAAISRIK